MEEILNNFYVVVGIWCLILSAFIVMTPLVTNMPQASVRKSLKVSMYLSCAVLVLLDISSSLFLGKKGNTAYYVVRIANYLVYLSKYLCIVLFGYYMQKEIVKYSKRRWIDMALLVGVDVLGVAVITFSLNTTDIWCFDSENYFYYSDRYEVVQFIFLINVVLLLRILWKNRSVLRKSTFCIFLFYIMLLLSTAILDFFLDMWYIQNLTIFFSTLLIFLDDMFLISRELVASQKKLVLTEYQAQHDLATGLWNKKNGIDQIKAYLEQMTSTDTAVLGFVDIDDFKSINDTYGHEIGDYWIKEVAQMLQSIVRSDDVVSRYGGDEYIIFFKNCLDIDAMKLRLEEFRRSLYAKALERKEMVHCSVGLCLIEGSENEVSDCIECADTALYEVKKRGKDSYLIYRLDKKRFFPASHR